MPPIAKHTEARFEDAVTQGFLDAGYMPGTASTFDRDRAVFPDDVIAYIADSQPKKWQAMATALADAARSHLLHDLDKELALKGTLHVLRHGFKSWGKTFALAAFRPASGMNPDAQVDYDRNLLRVTRQVPCSAAQPKDTVDLLLSVNGLPVVTMELKNPLSGQNVYDARKQCETDRNPKDLLFRFKERALVHFAIDPDLAFMTTRLAHADTAWLPFNRGNGFGAGNPPAQASAPYPTAHVWQDALAADSLLDLLARFVHLQVTEKQVMTPTGPQMVRKEDMIFPRFHQLDAVRDLVAHARQHKAGHNYLVQHSAGSGKSNTIAWLAHHLSNLHDAHDEKVFHSVLVLTDRRVLDQQLQATVYQFEHKKGVVQRIDENAQQLAKALSDGVPIVISTIQKFPYIAQALDTLAKHGTAVTIDTAGKRFAVVVDEAHSSQSGETAAELRKVLNRDGVEAVLAEQLLDLDEEDLSDEAKEGLLREMLKRPRQDNLSYFAFTATPKFKTRVVFDEAGKDGKSPFHLYSMRQAIEEGFILDVLANYTTYKRYYGLIKAVQDDPEVPRRQAAKALARIVDFHPHNLRQKVEIIVEHFRAFTKHKLGGRAKAMVVTGSRLHAVRYKIEFDKYVHEKGYTGIRSLVAFSGEVADPDLPGKKYTEVGMNAGIQERELPGKFAGAEYQVLLVAEKYQTGFDQPLLHTMYVDKRLSNVHAVQTLSRLNRMAPGKTETFVLDFVNEAEQIHRAFKPYYEGTAMGDMPEPQRLNALQHELDQCGVLDQGDVDAFCNIWFRSGTEPTPGEHNHLHGLVKQAVARFTQLEGPEQEDFRGKLAAFRNLYGFLSQVIPYQDSALEKLYAFGRYLLRMLPPVHGGAGIGLEDDVTLKYFRLQKVSEGAIQLATGEARPLKGPTETGTGQAGDDAVQLSTLIGLLNERFGTDFTLADQLFFDQVTRAAVENDKLRTAARVNTLENFKLVFIHALEGLFIDRLEGNELIFDRVMKDSGFRGMVADHLTRNVYEGARADMTP